MKTYLQMCQSGHVLENIFVYMFDTVKSQAPETSLK